MIAAFFGTLFAGIKATLILSFIGAGVGVGALVIGRLITGLQGYAAAAALGAIVLVGAYGSAAFDGARAHQKEIEIAQLKFDKAKIEQDLAAQIAANAKQDEIEKAQAKQIDADKAQMEKIEDLIKKHAGDNSSCVFPDELDEIFK